MRNKKLLFLYSLPIVIISLIFVFVFWFNTQSSDELSIEEILETEAYSYLSSSAKDFIIEYYEQNGVVLLTEKNKEENLPYLNQEYVEYLELSPSDKEQVEVIPQETLVDYVYDPDKEVNPKGIEDSKYDLRDVDGKNYVTPLKNQGGFGLCWAFATNAHAESHLLVTRDKEYSADATIFSERHTDFLTSYDGILDGNPYLAIRDLTGGGFFTDVMKGATNALSFVDTSFNGGVANYSYSGKLYRKDVFVTKNSLYEVNETSDFARLDLIDETDEGKKTAFINDIKRMIVDYGGLWVATDFYCSATINSRYLVNVTPSCKSGGRHALQVIGWDDEFEYSVCETTSGSINTNVDGCTGTVYTGKGAWILKNSWGNSTSYPYLAYDSTKSDFNGIISMSEGTSWDNNGFTFNNLGTSTKYISKLGSYSSKIFSFSNKDDESKTEKLKKIKFNVTATNQDFDFYLINGNKDVVDEDSYIKLSNQVTTHRGFYTIDLSGTDIVLNNDFSILVYPNSASYVNVDQVYVFSDNVENGIEINTLDVVDKSLEISSVKEHIFEISSFTSNILEGEELEYRIVSKTAGEIDVDYRVERAIVYNNEVFAKIYINGDLPIGEYYIQTIYNGVIYDTSLLNLTVEPIVTEGSGTIADPYLIDSSEHLSLLNEDRTAYFKLTSDIDLTYDTQNPDGLYYNDGKGWEPISYSSTSSVSNFGFSGGLDGDGYKIEGLYINRPDESYVGLFKGLYPISTTKNIVQNITFENVNIKGANYTAALAGNITSEEGTNYLAIKDIFIKSGIISGNYSVGSIAGQLRGGSNYSMSLDGTYYSSRNVFEKLYNNASVTGNSNVGGLFGYVSNQYSSYKPGKLSFSNLHSNGKVYGDSTYGSVFGYLYHTSNYNIVLNNSISSRIYDSGDVEIVGSQYKSSNGDDSKLELNYVYYNGEITLDADDITMNSTLQCEDLDCFKNATYWSDFSTYWEIETIDDVKRIPFLLDANVDYTSFDTINLNSATPYLNLYDLVNPNNTATRDFTYEVLNHEIASADNYGYIYGVKNGATTVKINSNYDGFDGVVDVVVDNIEMSAITFNSNGGTEVPSIIKGVGEVVSEPVSPTKEGYSFAGWYTDNGTFANKFIFSTMPSESITLYAKWDVEKLTITFNANGGEGSMDSITVNYGDRVLISTNSYTKKGHSFRIWNTEADGSGSNYIASRRYYTITKNLTLYAQWNVNNYILEFDSNGGEGTMEYQTFTYGVPAKISDNKFTKTDYVFIGWNTESDGSGKSYTNQELISLEDNVILYAQWTYKYHNVTFVSNGGTGSMTKQTFVYGESQKLNINQFVRDEYDFDSWNTKADGSGTKFSANQNVIVNEDLTLYAQWRESFAYYINKYSYDNNKKYIKNIAINTYVADFKKNIVLNSNYSLIVDYKLVNGKQVLYTGGKTKIYKNGVLYFEYTNVVEGDVNGDGKISYLDYVAIYNHIYKVKHSNSNKKLLVNSYLSSADMNLDGKISYLDYVAIYKKIKSLKGGV